MKKRAAFIGHYYHEKTGSSQFFKDIISQEFDVQYFNLNPGKMIDFEYIEILNESYDYYFFWQTEVIAAQLVDRLNGKVVIIPMYDAAILWNHEFWRSFPRALFISFSAELHIMLQKARCESIFVRFFPEVQERIWSSDEPLSAFFWERRPGENYDGRAVVKASASLGLEKLHVHLPSDFQDNIEDRREHLLMLAEEWGDGLELSFSDWFVDRKDLLAEANRHAIYFTPRSVEGIGMSFLEAMAAGQVVIGPNRPTLNEYVSNGETGFLLNDDLELRGKQRPDSEALVAMSDRCLELVEVGRERWLQDVDRLIAAISKGSARGAADSGSQFERLVRVAAGQRR